MERNPEPEAPRNRLRGGSKPHHRGGAGLHPAHLASRLPLFFLGSLGIGVVVAAILYFWNIYKPVKPEDIENKRPLGLG